MEDAEQVFRGKAIKRDFTICRKCKYLHVHEDGTFGCGNVLKGHGHPWCAESRKSLPAEYFARAGIFIANQDECLQNKKVDFPKENTCGKVRAEKHRNKISQTKDE